MATDIGVLKKRQEQIHAEVEEAAQLAELSHLLPKPKGIFIKRCPKSECSKKLTKRQWGRVFGVGGGGGHVIYTVYSCKCGYRYATSSL